MACQQVGLVLRNHIVTDILEVGLIATLLQEMIELDIVVGSLLITLSLQEVFVAVDDVAQLLGSLGGLILGKGTLSILGTSLANGQQRLAIVDVGLHLINIDRVALRMTVCHCQQRVLTRNPGLCLVVMSPMHEGSGDGVHGLLTLTQV